jgi:hypothetical protein
MTLSKVGLVLAVIYIVLAVGVLWQDRTGTGGGNWISLSGMSTYLVTIPVSAPFELMGAKLDYKKNIDMALAIGGCAVLVYLVGAGLGWIAKMMFAPPPQD